MLIIFLILIICFVVIVILYKAQPNLFMLQLTEKVFGNDSFIKKQLYEQCKKTGQEVI